MELDLNGGAPRMLWTACRSPNAMEVGPDGLLYYPLMGTNEIWRSRPGRRASEPQRVTGDLGVPDAVKFDSDGYIVSTQVASGQVLRIDPRSGEQTRAGAAEPRPGQFADRRRPAVRLELHRRDHRDPRRRRNPDRAAGRAELAAGSGGRRRRQAVRRRRHLFLRRAARRLACRPSGCCSRRAIRDSCAGWRRPAPASSW